MEHWWFLLCIGVLATSLVASFFTRKLAWRLGVTDKPDGNRKRHAKEIALMGGLPIAITFFTALWAIELSTGIFTTGMISRIELIGVTVASALLIVYGIIDDIKALSPRWSVLVSAAAALIVVLSGIEITKITNPIGGQITLIPLVSDIVVFVWIMLLIYSMKLLDGVDGLVTGMGTIASFVIAFLALTVAFYQPDVALMALLFASVLIGLLTWNFPPATIFLGESGSIFIGFMVAVFAVIAGSKVATALLVIGLPAIDMVAVIIHRLKVRKSVTKGDRLHLHFKLQDRGYKNETILFIYWTICIAFGLSTLVFESWQKLVALSILFVATAIGITLISHTPYGKRN